LDWIEALQPQAEKASIQSLLRTAAGNMESREEKIGRVTKGKK
jgi:hypothetical protein